MNKKNIRYPYRSTGRTTRMIVDIIASAIGGAKYALMPITGIPGALLADKVRKILDNSEIIYEEYPLHTFKFGLGAIKVTVVKDPRDQSVWWYCQDQE